MFINYYTPATKETERILASSIKKALEESASSASDYKFKIFYNEKLCIFEIEIQSEEPPEEKDEFRLKLFLMKLTFALAKIFPIKYEGVQRLHLKDLNKKLEKEINRKEKEKEEEPEMNL